AERRVVANLERRDARPLTLRRLEAGEPALAVARRLAEGVDLGVAPRANEAGNARVRWRRVDQRGGDLGRDLGQRIERACQALEERRLDPGQSGDGLAHTAERAAEVRQVARAGAAGADAPGQPVEVPDAVERGAERAAHVDPLDEFLDRVEASADRRQVAEWIEEPFPQPPDAHRRPGVVQHPEKRAAALAPERLQ